VKVSVQLSRDESGIFQDKTVAEALEVACYFAKLYHSWERVAKENLNGLARQYFPEGMNFGRITEQKVNEVVDILNHRPRKRSGFRSPEEVFQNVTLNLIL
jgi:IS30 family transposase